MAKKVSVETFFKWLKENEWRTWKLENFYHHSDVRPKQIKYITPKIDTRLMEVFRVESDRAEADFREEFDGTILDLLVHKIENGDKPCKKQ